jgi:aspartate 1-decarboxylase
LACVGDIIIIMTYVEIDEPVPEFWEPRVVIVDAKNEISEIVTMDRLGEAVPAHHRFGPEEVTRT